MNGLLFRIVLKRKQTNKILTEFCKGQFRKNYLSDLKLVFNDLNISPYLLPDPYWIDCQVFTFIFIVIFQMDHVLFLSYSTRNLLPTIY